MITIPSSITYQMFQTLYPGKALREVREAKMKRSQNNVTEFVVRATK